MDLHLTADRPTETEKKAVDAELVSFDSGSAPEPSASAGAGRVARDDRAARDMLLPLLHALQRSAGWISPGAINYLALRLDVPPAEIYGVASFYAMFSMSPRPPVVAHVCDDIACLVRGADSLCQQMEKKFGPPGTSSATGRSTWLPSSCLGLCDRAPAALISAAGENPREQTAAPATLDSLVSALDTMVKGQAPGELHEPELHHSLSEAGAPRLQILRRIGRVNPASIEDYRRQGGYEALHRAIEIGPEQVVREVIDSRILGRGGAAFSTGKKWESLFLARKPGSVHYLVCNADESEPGTFKDRVLMEGDPFAILEGMTIAAFAAGAEKGYIYIRGEYPRAAECIAHAIKTARAHGMLGQSILGSSPRFDIELRSGAGAYICGEETALFNSIEGYRGEPRNKPPFPTQAGLFSRPTLVNNVETLANIPGIILEGGAAYARTGTPQSSGSRLFCLSGHVKSPGVYEVAMGESLRSLIDRAGGVGGSGKLQAVLLGGAAGSFLAPGELDMPLSFEAARAAGATLGSGAVILFDDSTDLRQILLRIARFFREETCGQCVPCRVGTTRQDELLHRLAARQPIGPVAGELKLFGEIGQTMRDASICGLGQTASNAIASAMSRWSLFS